jgi:PAS domain S-box-containing protein
LKNILIVEDESIIADAVRHSLENMGYRVLLAASEEAAIALAAEGIPLDLVLMDIGLGPGMDGTGAALRILAIRTLPIVFLIARSERESLDRLKGVTHYGYVIKDSDDFVLQTSIEMAFELFSAHEELRKSRAFISSLVQTIPDMIWLKDKDGVYLACNHAFERYFGKSEAEIVGKTDYDFLDRAKADFFRENDRMAMELGRQRSNEEWITFAADGREALLETTKTPMRDESGRLIGVLGVSHDITERKRIELALKESEASVRRKLDAIVEPRGDLSELGISDIVDVDTLRSFMEDFSAITGMATAILDLKGRVLVGTGWQDICTKFHRARPASAAACAESDLCLSRSAKCGEIVGYRCGNMLWDIVTPLYIKDRHVGNIFTGQFFYDDDEVGRAAFEAQAEKYGFDKAAYLAALERIPRFSHRKIELLMDYLLRLTNFISRLSYSNLELARSISERGRAEELLSRTVEEKEVLLRELQHRVKNSLGTVSSLLSLNMADLGDERARKVFQEAIDRVRSIAMIYEKLTSTTGGDRVELGKYFADLVELLKSTYASRSGRLSIVADYDKVDCDLKRAVSLGLILNELFTNALKYAYKAGEDGEIRIMLKARGEEAELSVADDGPGLPPGIDLSQVKSLGLRIVSLLAGEIDGRLEISEGRGASVAVRFKV